MFGRIDHVGVAVEDMDSALQLYGETLGLELQHREVVEEQGVDAALLGIGDGHVELLAPLSEDSPVGRYLASAGRAYTTWPTQWRTSSRRWSASARRVCA